MRDKPVIVLIHGHGVDASIWNGLYAELATDSHVIKPDLSELTQHETIDAYAEDIFSRLQSFPNPSVVLVGHSMGGYIALAFAEQHSDLVSGLVLLNSTAFADTEEKKQAREQSIIALQQHGSGYFIGQTVPKMFGSSFSKNRAQEVEHLVQQFSNLPAGALIAGMRAMAARPDRVQVLQKAVFPVLVMAGKEDQIIPFAKSQELFDQLPKAQTVPLEQAGHLGMIETPEEVTQAIKHFVSTVNA
ncbi:alpha/beta fold hydrolase [Larkinella sp. VNQ87]|uniref:alpha/beta fold hydrolase n=1 Tax=Larkinella sp. VNQ87 TaxID=3400921 RepID=UPI003C0ADBAE